MILDRNAPVDALFFRRVIARRIVVRAAIVPDDDIASAPLVAVLVGRLRHESCHLVDDGRALGFFKTFDAEDLVLVEIEQLASGLDMRADDLVAGGLRVAVFRIQQEIGFLAPAVLEQAVSSFEAVFQALRKLLVGRVCAGEMRVAALARDGDGVELGRFVRNFFVRAVSVKAFGAAQIDVAVKGAVGTELVRAEQRDFRIVGMARGLGRVRTDEPEAPAVFQIVVDPEFLVAHRDDVAVKPRLVDFAKGRVVHGLDVHAGDECADRPHMPDFHAISPSDSYPGMLPRMKRRGNASAGPFDPTCLPRNSAPGIAAVFVEFIGIPLEAFFHRQFPWAFALIGALAPGITGGRDAAVRVAVRAHQICSWHGSGRASRQQNCECERQAATERHEKASVHTEYLSCGHFCR